MEGIMDMLLHKMKNSKRYNEMIFKFKVMNTDEHRVLATLVFLSEFEICPPLEIQKKCSQKSLKLRKKANQMYTTSNNIEELLEAWKMYNQSIAYAPNDSQELALAYGNRSAILFRFQKYKESLHDINIAIQLNYPENLVGKILIRKIDCLRNLENNEKDDILEMVKNWFNTMHINTDDAKKIEKKLEENTNSETIVKSKIISTERRRFETHLAETSPRYPCASTAIKVQYNTEFGRHVVATRKINVGEVLVIENPYAIILNQENAYSHCANCFQVSWAMIPCEYCIHEMYCSLECKNKAWKRSHEIECKVNGYLINLGFNVRTLLSLRLAILAIKQSGNIQTLITDLKNIEDITDPLCIGCSWDNIYHSHNYQSFYTLTTNVTKRSISDLFERALNAAFVTFYVATQTEFFGKKISSKWMDICNLEACTFFAGLVLRHQQLIPSNVHSFQEEYKLDSLTIGAAVLPFSSLINHSCNPNISRCSGKDCIYIFAIHPIEDGMQIYDNYGAHYATTPKDIRTNLIQQYYFTCKCQACLEDWPLYVALPSYKELVKDGTVLQTIDKVLHNFDSIYQWAFDGTVYDKPNILSDLQKMIDILMKYMNRPCSELCNIIETYKRIFALLYGNKFDIPKLKLL